MNFTAAKNRKLLANLASCPLFKPTTMNTQKSDETIHKNNSNHSKRKFNKDETRLKILDAAKKVFSEHSYKAASIRMIGKAGQIDHPLISYYYPSKAALFEAVLTDIGERLQKMTLVWYKGVADLSSFRGMSIFLDRLFDYHLKYPEHLRIIALNAVQTRETELIPAYNLIQGLSLRDTEFFIGELHLRSPRHEIEMFSKSLNALIISYLGADSFYANLLSMDPQSIEYLNWVKETILYLFVPKLKEMISAR